MIRYLFKSLQYLKVVMSSRVSTWILQLVMRINKVDFGKNVKTMKVVPDLIINRKATCVKFGSDVVFNNYSDHSWNCKCKIIVRPEASLCIGNNVGMNGVMIYCSDKIVIGNNAKIGGGTRIFDTNHHSLDYIQRRSFTTDVSKTAPIIIEDDVFIGAGCYIEKGVTIGTHSIIAAGSVVVKSIPSNCIAGGNPCKIIRMV